MIAGRQAISPSDNVPDQQWPNSMLWWAAMDPDYGVG